MEMLLNTRPIVTTRLPYAGFWEILPDSQRGGQLRNCNFPVGSLSRDCVGLWIIKSCASWCKRGPSLTKFFLLWYCYQGELLDHLLAILRFGAIGVPPWPFVPVQASSLENSSRGLIFGDSLKDNQWTLNQWTIYERELINWLINFALIWLMGSRNCYFNVCFMDWSLLLKYVCSIYLNYCSFIFDTVVCVFARLDTKGFLAVPDNILYNY